MFVFNGWGIFFGVGKTGVQLFLLNMSLFFPFFLGRGRATGQWW